MTGCFYCHSVTKELRPYGPGGAPTCFPCMKASPEREVEAEGRFGALLEANEAISPNGAVVLTQDGPEPFTPPVDQTGAET